MKSPAGAAKICPCLTALSAPFPKVLEPTIKTVSFFRCRCRSPLTYFAAAGKKIPKKLISLSHAMRPGLKSAIFGWQNG